MIATSFPLGLASAAWRKSSLSGSGANCVELATLPLGETAMRDSKRPDGAVLVFSADSIGAFFAAVKAGEFDRP